MEVLAAIAGLIGVVWGAIYARRGSLVVGLGVFVLVGYVVGYEFWHARIGPLPLSFDRAVLAGLLAAAVVQWRIGILHPHRLVVTDWILISVTALFALSAWWSGPPEIIREGNSVWGRWFASFILPGLLYAIAREAPISKRQWCGLLAVFALLGVYLSFTAVCEIAHHWALVFPRYISDPNLGIHFGRARGPGLNSASLGVYITTCFWCAWLLVGQTTRRGWQLVLLTAVPLLALGVFLTYTRSTWIGLAVSGLVVGCFQTPRQWRMPAAVATGLVGLVVVAVSWSQVVGLQREGSAEESEHSVDQRASFAYVSWQMFKEHPLTGVGFGRFYDQKMSYLSDRRQHVELESIRSLDHHNTFLSVLTETGLIGFAAFAALLIAWTRQGWLLVRSVAALQWARASGLLMLAVMANYLCSALFHDLSLLPALQWPLFLFAGLTINLRQQGWADARKSEKVPVPGFLTNVVSHPKTALAEPVSPTTSQSSSVNLFGMELARVTMDETVNRVLEWCAAPFGPACRYVVTPNVDHAVMFQERADLRAAYADASLVLADGAPIVLASRLVGRSLPERVAGSDLAPRLFAQARQPLRVFLLGAAPGVAEQAAENLCRQWQFVDVVGTYSPPIGFESDDAENARILAMVAKAKPDLLIVGFGAPKQELWVHRHQNELHAKVALCAGATIDFLAGHRRRSPLWMQRAGLEWLHRVLREPRRLAKRYVRDAWVFPWLVWREMRRSAS